jgi:hypothetical protein
MKRGGREIRRDGGDFVTAGATQRVCVRKPDGGGGGARAPHARASSSFTGSPSQLVQLFLIFYRFLAKR